MTVRNRLVNSKTEVNEVVCRVERSNLASFLRFLTVLSKAGSNHGRVDSRAVLCVSIVVVITVIVVGVSCSGRSSGRSSSCCSRRCGIVVVVVIIACTLVAVPGVVGGGSALVGTISTPKSTESSTAL